MNNRQALSREDIEKRLDAIRDPITGRGLCASDRVSGLDVRDGKVSFTIEAPRDVPVHRLEIANKIAAEKGELTYDEINELRERMGGK